MDKYLEYPPIDYKNRNTVQLLEIAEIVRAPLLKNEPGKNGSPFSILSIKDFPVAGYIPPPQKHILLTNNRVRAAKYIVKDFDVLLTIVGTVGKVTILPEDTPPNWIPATNIIRIRFRRDQLDNAIELYTWLKSDSGKRTLAGFTHGTTISIVTKGQILSIRLPVLSDDVREKTRRIWDEEQRLFRQAQEQLDRSQNIFRSYCLGEPDPYLIRN